MPEAESTEGSLESGALASSLIWIRPAVGSCWAEAASRESVIAMRISENIQDIQSYRTHSRYECHPQAPRCKREAHLR